MTKPYDELFADTLAVFIAKDPDAMAQVEVDSIRSFNPKQKKPGNYLEEIDSHTFFFDSRQVLWSKYKQKGLSIEYAQKILFVLYKTIWAEISYRAANETLINLSKLEIDHSFLTRLSRELDKIN